jgi:hypothetical protein
MEQTHFDNKYQKYTDFEMFVPLKTKANDVSVLKLLKGKPNSPALAESESSGDKNQSLGIKGVSDDGDVMFTYENK